MPTIGEKLNKKVAAASAKDVLGDKPEDAEGPTREEAVGLLNDAVANYRGCLRLDPDHAEARHNLEVLRLWMKHMQEVWARRDRQKRPVSWDKPDDVAASVALASRAPISSATSRGRTWREYSRTEPSGNFTLSMLASSRLLPRASRWTDGLHRYRGCNLWARGSVERGPLVSQSIDGKQVGAKAIAPSANTWASFRRVQFINAALVAPVPAVSALRQ